MNILLNYNQRLFEKVLTDIEMIEFFDKYDILESIVTDMNSLLKSIAAEDIDLFYTFNINPETYNDDVTIEQIYDSKEFNSALDKKGYRKSPIEESKDVETFLEKTMDLKYFFVYKKDQSELDTPQFIILQSKDKKEDIWEHVKTYKVKDDINKFFSKLTSKTIELKRDGKTYIYNTSNSGNDWQLNNIDEKDDEFKEFLTNPEIKNILKRKNTSITII